ncbi:MAG: response regulator [Methanomicrobiales archaeon]|nr:response regulator [Methanomicrobiales archaeon]
MFSVLYVDDEPALLEIGKLFLEKKGEITIHLAESAKNAITILQNLDVDVIISDYDMPDMNGIEFLKYIRRSGNQIPFIIFTGKGREEVVIEAIENGADSYIQKTGDPKTIFQNLRQKIDSVVRLKLAEKEIRRKSREWDGLFNSTERVTLVVNTNQKILSANRASTILFKSTEEQLLGKDFFPFFYQDDGKKSSFKNVLESKKFYSDIVTSDNLNKTFDISYTPVLDEEGEIEKIILMASDITQRIKNEEDLKKYRENLEELVRERTVELAKAKELAESSNKAKTTFLSNMSHELRTPLNAILGYTQILQRYNNITPEQKEQLKTIYSSGKHLLNLINDLLDLSKIEAQVIQVDEKSFNLMSLFKEVYNITRIKAEEKNLSFSFEPITPIPSCVLGDEGKLRQILINLLNNAIKYTDTGTILFRVSYGIAADHVLQCEIIDTGKGIPVNKNDEIFRPFTQIGEHGEMIEGTGLGLAITKSLVEFMNGTLTFVSEEGKGTKFTITITFPPTLTFVPENKEIRNIIGYEGDRKKILIVDDNISNASFLEAFLQPLDFFVMKATNGPDALLITSHYHPDIILLDFVMSGMSGLDVIHEIRKNTALDDIKIIGISASVSRSEYKHDFKASCDEFLVKPVDINVLLNVLGRYLNIIWKEEIIDDDTDTTILQPLTTYEIQPPSEELLNNLELLAKQGNFTKINQMLIQMEQEENPDRAFIHNVRQNCMKFNDDAIISLIRSMKHDR